MLLKSSLAPIPQSLDVRRVLVRDLRDTLALLYTPDAILDDGTDDPECPWFSVATPLDVDLIAEFSPEEFVLRTPEGYRGVILLPQDYSQERVLSWFTHMVTALGRQHTLH